MINVNTVYQTVLFILNKEQRGYMTPAEFNSLATQVQLEIFDKYFEDLNVFLRQPTNDSEYANRIKTVEEKISIFEEQKILQTPYDLTTLDPTFYKLGSVTYERSTLNHYGPEYPTVLEEIKCALDSPVYSFHAVSNSSVLKPIPVHPLSRHSSITVRISLVLNLGLSTFIFFIFITIY